jgi:hypothetical protein
MLGVKGVISSLVGREQCVHVGRLSVPWSLGRNFDAKEVIRPSVQHQIFAINAEAMLSDSGLLVVVV